MLGVAVLEDIVLYVVLAIAVGYAGGTAGSLFGLPAALGIEGGTGADMIYHVVGRSLSWLSVFSWPTFYRWWGASRGT